MQLLALAMHAIKVPGIALPGFERAVLSVVVLAVVALVWYLMRFKDVQRLAALHRAALDNMENAVLLADPGG
jgi:hypothetical protein